MRLDRSPALAQFREIPQNTRTVLSESLAEVLLKDECDVRTYHPTSVMGDAGVADTRKTQCPEEVLPTTFSRGTQEVPGCVAELEPEELTLGILLPAADCVGSAKVESEEVLYADTTTPVNGGASTVDNEEVQRLLNLQEVFSFHTLDGMTVPDTTDGITVQDITYQMMTDETVPIDDDDVANALSHSGNEFPLTPEREITTLQTGREECFQLGSGDCSPTTEDRKENTEDKTYFHPVRLPCRYESGDAHLSMESRLSSSWQQEAASPIGAMNTERRPTKLIGTTLSPTVKPRGYQRSHMRAFNREFGYKTRKHPISCRRQSDIRRWIPDDNRKDCRTFQVLPGSSNDDSRGEKPQSYVLHLERQLSLVAQSQEQQSCHLTLNTSLGDNQKDVTCNRAAIDNTDDRHQERHLPLAADDQRELPNDACPPLFGHDNRYHYVQTELPSTRLETDKRACRYGSDHHDIGAQVPSTWLTMFPSESSDAHEKCRAFQQ